MTAFAEELRGRIVEVTGGLTASVGIGTSKFIAKVASDLDKPDGLVVVPPGTEVELLRPMHVTVIPGVGPATAERLRKAGIHTVAELESVSIDELVRLVGKAHGTGLFALARAEDDRPVVAEREAKSVSVEGTYETDLTDRKLMEGLLTRQASEVAGRLRKHGLSGRTITIKVRLHDFTTLSRSTTLSSPTDSTTTVARLARELLADLDTSGGVRLLGVGVSGLADWIQDDLFGEIEPEEDLEPSRRRGAGRPAHDLGAGHGRRARRDGPWLGVGIGPRGGHGPVRDRRDRARPGPLLRHRRPRSAPLAARNSGAGGGPRALACRRGHPPPRPRRRRRDAHGVRADQARRAARPRGRAALELPELPGRHAVARQRRTGGEPGRLRRRRAASRSG